VRLAELGEFGLLGELEGRGLASGIEHDAARLEGGLVVTPSSRGFTSGWIGHRGATSATRRPLST
jgi:hypothetical protein